MKNDIVCTLHNPKARAREGYLPCIAQRCLAIFICTNGGQVCFLAAVLRFSYGVSGEHLPIARDFELCFSKFDVNFACVAYISQIAHVYSFRSEAS